MTNKFKISILALVVMIAAVVAYLFTIGPLGNPALATVNGENILVAGFQKELKTIEPNYREVAKENPGKLLDILINKALLLQAAKKEGIAAPAGNGASTPGVAQDAETLIITAYLDKKMGTLPPVSPEELAQIYETYKDQLGGRKKEEAMALLRQMVEQQRQSEEAERLIDDLRKGATIKINQKALQKLAVIPPEMETQSEGDFRKALAGGKPMVVDLGSNSCIPCRQLRPILQKIRKDYMGKLEVLIIDINNNPQLVSEYKVQLIPTVVFFDATGKEIFRNQGFMSEEKIKEQLAKMGVV
ncbi:MAG: thioredoxin domain-containing protein [Syntrophales bacterium]|jgi:thioredoxin 1|nr:thioredoxin domain-containing protein [Syntrophales bacterium]